MRLSRNLVVAMGVAAVVLGAGTAWGVFYDLGPSKDEWKLKYDVKVSAAEGEKVNVVFTLADEGRLKPIYSATVVAFSKPDSDGGRSYTVKAPIELKKNKEGTPGGAVQIPREFADGAAIRILTQTFDGQRHPSARYYDIPLKKFLGEEAQAKGK